MGVPCVTLAGGCHAHNVGASLLTAVGLDGPRGGRGGAGGWVARSEDEYVELAVHQVGCLVGRLTVKAPNGPRARTRSEPRLQASDAGAIAELRRTHAEPGARAGSSVEHRSVPNNPNHFTTTPQKQHLLTTSKNKS
jgi:hypothetical protein